MVVDLWDQHPDTILPKVLEIMERPLWVINIQVLRISIEAVKMAAMEVYATLRIFEETNMHRK